MCNSRGYKLEIKNLNIEKSKVETLKEKNLDFDTIKNKEFLTVKDASILLNFSTKTVYRLIESNSINSFNFSHRKTLIRRKDLDIYFESNIFNKNKYLDVIEDTISLDNSYTIQEVQQKYGISSGALYNLIIRFKIPKKKQGKYTLVRKEDIDKIFT